MSHRIKETKNGIDAQRTTAKRAGFFSQLRRSDRDDAKVTRRCIMVNPNARTLDPDPADSDSTTRIAESTRTTDPLDVVAKLHSQFIVPGQVHLFNAVSDSYIPALLTHLNSVIGLFISDYCFDVYRGYASGHSELFRKAHTYTNLICYLLSAPDPTSAIEILLKHNGVHTLLCLGNILMHRVTLNFYGKQYELFTIIQHIVHEILWAVTNIAAGTPEQAKSLTVPIDYTLILSPELCSKLPPPPISIRIVPGTPYCHYISSSHPVQTGVSLLLQFLDYRTYLFKYNQHYRPRNLETVEMIISEIHTQAVWALANLAACNSSYRDLIVQQGGLKKLSEITEKSMMRTVTWCISNILRNGGYSLLPHHASKVLFQKLFLLLNNVDDIDMASDIYWILCHLSTPLPVDERNQPIVPDYTALLNTNRFEHWGSGEGEWAPPFCTNLTLIEAIATMPHTTLNYSTTFLSIMVNTIHRLPLDPQYSPVLSSHHPSTPRPDMNDMAKPSVARKVRTTEEMLPYNDTNAVILIPILRTIGNMLAHGGPQIVEAVLSNAGTTGPGTFLSRLLPFYSNALLFHPNQRVRQIVLWIFSTIMDTSYDLFKKSDLYQILARMIIGKPVRPQSPQSPSNNMILDSSSHINSLAVKQEIVYVVHSATICQFNDYEFVKYLALGSPNFAYILAQLISTTDIVYNHAIVAVAMDTLQLFCECGAYNTILSETTTNTITSSTSLQPTNEFVHSLQSIQRNGVCIISTLERIELEGDPNLSKSATKLLSFLGHLDVQEEIPPATTDMSQKFFFTEFVQPTFESDHGALTFQQPVSTTNFNF